LKKRGMALMLVLTVTSVVVMMTGAFVAANHANFASLGASQRQREAELVTDSATQYIYYRLEQDQKFGSVPFRGNDEIPLQDGGLRVYQVDGKTEITGTLIDEGGSGREPSFRAHLYNNLGTLHSENQGVKVPPDCVLIRITGKSGSFTSHCDILYRGEPLFDASVTANKMVQMASNGNINIASTDKSRNWLRSNESIEFNRFAYGSGSTKIEPTPGGLEGVVWAKGKIFSGKKNGDNDPGLEGAALGTASEKAGGVLAPKSRLNHDIYKLTPDDLNLGNKGTQTWGNVAPGTYSVDRGNVTWFEYGKPKSATVQIVSYTPPSGVTQFFYDGSQWGAGAILPQGWGVASAVSDTDGVVRLGGTTDYGAALTYNFKTNTFSADNSAIQVDGDLRITSKVDGVVPSIKLKSDANSTGVIKATHGSISIQGTLTGGGALVADGDIHLMCNPQVRDGDGAAVDADKNSGVVLYGKNVNIYGANNRTVDFKGLIYAEEDVKIMGGVKVITDKGQLTWVATDNKLDKLSLEGAVVARTGGVNITETDEVNLTYNQDYLNALTKGMPDNRRRIAHLWTRKF